MGLFDRMFGRKASDPLALWAEIARAGRTSKAGPTVNLDNALKVATVFACLKVLSQGCAQVPFKLFREAQEGGLTKITPARDLPLYDLMASKPNDWQTSFEFREQLVIHAGLGNAFVWKNTIDGVGRDQQRIAELVLLNPARMVVNQQDERLAPVYEYTTQNGTVLHFDRSTIWHVRGPSWAGFVGMDVLKIARESLGLAMALEDSHASLHKNGVRPSGVYSVEGNLSTEQQEKLVKWLKKESGGPDNVGAPLVLDRAAKWLSQTMTGVDAQHLETRRFELEEICRFMGVSPFMVFHTDKAPTYASAEQFQIQHVVHTLSPWYARIEGSADVNLLTDKQRAQGLYFKFVSAGLLRGAMKDQGEFFAKMLGSGGTRQVMTQDEIRALLELNPMGGDAAVLHEPTGSTPPPGPTPAEKEQMKSLEMKLAAVESRPALPPVINITLNQEPVTVKHEGGAVTVNTPEMKAAAAPVVNVQNDIHVPPGPAPSVTVENNIQKQDAPHVTLEAVLPPLTVNAVMPARKTHTETTVKHDKNGKIVGSVSDGSEKDA
jgi:HK97 family phage portal protein